MGETGDGSAPILTANSVSGSVTVVVHGGEVNIALQANSGELSVVERPTSTATSDHWVATWVGAVTASFIAGLLVAVAVYWFGLK